MPQEKQVGQIYEGDVYIRRWNAGVLDPNVIGPISGTQLGIKAQSEIKQNISKGRGTHGQAVDSLTVSKPTEFSLGFNRATSLLLAMVFLGTAAANTDASGTITAEAITLPHDQWVKVSQRNISAVAITGGVLDTDFVVDSRLGMIMSLSTGSLADGVMTTFNATVGEITSMRILGGVESKVDVEVVLDGMNQVTEKDVYIRVPSVPLIPESEMDFLDDDFITIEFSGEMVKLDSEGAEFYIDGDVTLA